MCLCVEAWGELGRGRRRWGLVTGVKGCARPYTGLRQLASVVPGIAHE